ncbi:MAG: hypothetical protein HC837_03940 [Chloroflexaceae bacterium]|nr:hypothetical protein [Chloroflexaceae bacterium]
MNDTTPITRPDHFLVILPGWMGSKLRDRTTGEIAWIDFASIPWNPFEWDGWVASFCARLAYPNDQLEPFAVMDEVVFVPPWARQEHYNRLITALQQMGYQTDPAQPNADQPCAYTFPYDWRQDNRISARQLRDAVDRWRQQHPGAQVWMIAHSNGGLVARWYIEKEGGKAHVTRLLVMGSPWDGTPVAMRVLFSGLETLFRQRFDLFDIPRRTRDLVRTFPSMYQLLPHQEAFLRDGNSQPIDPFTQNTWLEDDTQRQLLLDGLRFNQELGVESSVETLCFFGRKQETLAAGMVRIAAGGQWQSIEWTETEIGDGTIRERSAVHPDADQKLPFVTSHGDIYVFPPVLEFLQWELVDRYGPAVVLSTRTLLISDDLQVQFTTDQDIYAPGLPIALSCRLQRPGQPPQPVTQASITARLTWRDVLPGDAPPTMPVDEVSTALSPMPAEPGQYQGTLTAPLVPGYYTLNATIKVTDSEPIQVQELLAVEATP